MRLRNQLISLLIVLLLTLAVLPAAFADTSETEEDYVIRIEGGVVSEHLETVNGKECLRVDLFLEGVTSERLLSSISFKLKYDADRITFEKSKSLPGNGAMSMINANVPGLVQYAYISTNGSLLDGNTPLLTLWFTVAENLPEGVQIRFAFTEAIKAESIVSGSYTSHKRTCGANLSPFYTSWTVRFGDANCDGEITPADASLVLRALVELEPLTGLGLLNAKVDGADDLSAQDAALILRYLVRLIERFPVQE